MFDDYTTLFRCTWSGTLGTGPDEIFSYSRWVVAGDTATPTSISGILASDVTDMLAESSTAGPFTAVGQAFPTVVKWTNLAVWAYDEVTGVWDPDQPRVDTPLTDHGAGSGLPFLPFQCSMAITLRTAARGRRERNRFYLPPMMAAAAPTQSMWLPQLIDDIQTQLDFSQTAHITTDLCAFAIYSPADHLAKKIDTYYTGSVVDTIRRRRNRLVESRHVLSA
jgi:hypothetical protein